MNATQNNPHNNMRNKVQLIGRVEKEAVCHFSDDGKKCAQVSLSTREVSQGTGNSKVIEVQWHRLVGWGDIADLMAMMRKGKEVAVEGRLTNNLYDDGTGNARAFTEIMVNDLVIIG